MSKLQILLIQIVVCLGLGVMLGMAFWLFDGGKTRKVASVYPGGASNEQKKANDVLYIRYWENPPVKVYRGVWHKEFLEVMK